MRTRAILFASFWQMKGINRRVWQAAWHTMEPVEHLSFGGTLAILPQGITYRTLRTPGMGCSSYMIACVLCFVSGIKVSSFCCCCCCCYCMLRLPPGVCPRPCPCRSWADQGWRPKVYAECSMPNHSAPSLVCPFFVYFGLWPKPGHYFIGNDGNTFYYITSLKEGFHKIFNAFKPFGHMMEK